MSIRDLKEWLKENAVDIRNHKISTKNTQRDRDWLTAGTMQIGLLAKQKRYRHHHVAYSELLGRTRDQIEKTRRKETPRLDETWIQRIKEEYTADEAVRIGS